jgi:dynactin complex subunit
LRWHCIKRQIAFPVADSSKGWRAMTAIEFRRKKMSELESLLEKLDSVKQSTLKPELKDLFTRTCLRQIDRITAILDSPALARLCS